VSTSADPPEVPAKSVMWKVTQNNADKIPSHEGFEGVMVKLEFCNIEMMVFEVLYL